MKKRFLFSVIVAGLFILFSCAQTFAGEIVGISIVGYDRESREIFGYSGTWLDFDAAYYYDPAVQGELYWQFNNEVPLDSGYSEGFGVFPAEVWLYSAQYLPLTVYSTYSNHFVIAYYYYCYDYCYYNYWYDPFRFDFLEGGDFGGWYYLEQPDFYPYCFVYAREIYVFSTGASIRTPSDLCSSQQVAQFDETGTPCPGPTPTPTPTPSPGQCNTPGLKYITERQNNGIPMSNQSAPPATSDRPYRNSTIIIAAGTPTGGTYTWSTSSNKVAITDVASSPTSSQATIKALSPSDSQGDVVIDVTYSVSSCNSSKTEHIAMTVQRPTSMHYISTVVNRRIAAYRDPADGRMKAGWEKDIFWQVYDQLGHPLTYALPLADTINNKANSCRAPLQGKGTPFSEGKGTDGNGIWKHIYTIFSPNCLQGGNCGIEGYQEYTINGFVLSNDRKSFVYTCNGISLSGDGSNITAPGSPPKTTEGMVDSFWVGTLQTIADDSSYQYWTNLLNSAQAQGSSQLLTQARTLGRSLFQSSSYVALNRSDQDFVTDLYYAYLQRDPDAGGYGFWLATLQSDNANGLNGREHLLQGFEGSTEFINLVNSLIAADPIEDACNPLDQQDCNNTGGSWDPDSCTCTPVCSSYDEQSCYYYGGYWDSSSCRCYY